MGRHRAGIADKTVCSDYFAPADTTNTVEKLKWVRASCFGGSPAVDTAILNRNCTYIMVRTRKPAQLLVLAVGISIFLTPSRVALMAAPPFASPDPYAPAQPEPDRQPPEAISSPPPGPPQFLARRSLTRIRKSRRCRLPRRRRPTSHCRSTWPRRCTCRMPGRWLSLLPRTASRRAAAPARRRRSSGRRNSTPVF